MATDGALIITELGGDARSIRLEDKHGPFRPLETPVEHDAPTTKYPGNPRRTVQMLGPLDDDVVFRGKWRDRWGGEDYVENAERLLRSMCEDGNELDVEALNWRRRCILRRFAPTIMWRGHSNWELTFRVLESHQAQGATDTFATVATPTDLADGVEDALAGLEGLDSPLGVLDDTLDDFDAGMARARDQMDDLRDEVESSAVVAGAQRILESAQRAHALAGGIHSEAAGMQNTLRGLTPATLSTFQDGLGQMQATSYLAAALVGLGDLRVAAEIARRLFDEQRQERVRSTVFGRIGRTLSELALRFYGTPHDWPRIARANGLSANLISTAAELVIPE